MGHSIITRANQAFRDHASIWDALGMLNEDLESRKAILEELSAVTPNGQRRRRALQEAISHTCHEFHGLGVEMNQRYSGPGIHDADEKQAYARHGKAAEDPVLYHEPITYPGCRLPHVWLNKSVPGKPVSTIDLAGHGAFNLFTGVGGEPWKIAAESVSNELGVPLWAHSIGFRQDWEDMYYDWERVRGVDESGAVLVRPDRFVAWRVPEVLENAEMCERKLGEVLRLILGIINL